MKNSPVESDCQALVPFETQLVVRLKFVFRSQVHLKWVEGLEGEFFRQVRSFAPKTDSPVLLS